MHAIPTQYDISSIGCSQPSVVQVRWPDADPYEIHLMHIVSDSQWTQEYGLHTGHKMNVSTGLHALRNAEQQWSKAETASTCHSRNREQTGFLKLG